MKIHLLTVANRAEAWVEAGYAHYATRLTREVVLQLHTLPLPKRSKTGVVAQWQQREAELIEAALPPHSHTVALEVNGQPWSTAQLAAKLQQWREAAQPVALLIGGPDGLLPALSGRCREQWSLSPLTLPHPLVRIVVAEQLYRAWSLLQGHPYHRE